MARANLTGIDWANPDEVRRYYKEYQQRPKVKKHLIKYRKSYYKNHKGFWRKYDTKQKKQYRKDFQRKTRLTINGKGVGGLNKRDWTGYCELCGKDKIRLGYHHWDSSDLNKGLWVCSPCHWGIEHYDKYGFKIINRYKKFQVILTNEKINTIL